MPDGLEESYSNGAGDSPRQGRRYYLCYIFVRLGVHAAGEIPLQFAECTISHLLAVSHLAFCWGYFYCSKKHLIFTRCYSSVSPEAASNTFISPLAVSNLSATLSFLPALPQIWSWNGWKDGGDSLSLPEGTKAVSLQQSSESPTASISSLQYFAYF